MYAMRKARVWLPLLTVSLLVGMLLPAATIARADALPDAGVPLPPVHVHATAGPGYAVVSWSPGASNGGLPIYQFNVERLIAPATLGVTPVDPGSACKTADGTMTCEATIKGLQQGATTSFVVRAINPAGTSAASDRSNPVTWLPRVNVPDPPLGVSAVPGAGSAAVYWSPGASDGGSPITGYEITVYAGQSAHELAYIQAKPDARSAAVKLDNGAPYTVAVQALNATGWSALSARVGVFTPLAIPDAPGKPWVSAQMNGVTLGWNAPRDNGSPITAYIVTAYAGYSTSAALTRKVDAGTTSISITTQDLPELRHGVRYTFTVMALNAAGASGESQRSDPATALGIVPEAPAAVQALAGSDGAHVSWSQPADNGRPILYYLVAAYRASDARPTLVVTVAADTTTTVVTGLSFGDTYTFAVNAVNDIGPGLQSPRSNPIRLVAAPGAPTSVSAAAGIGSATITWTPPATDGGSPISGYLITAYRDNGATAVATMGASAGTATFTMTGLAAGTTYSFRVVAVNAAGQSAPSALSNAVTLPAAPSAPQNLAATAGDGAAQITWNAPASDGGRPITGYQVTVTDGSNPALTITSLSPGASLTGLANGTTYTVSVVAVNAVGQSPAATATVTPKNDPPTLNVPGSQTTTYGQVVSFDVSATDPEAGDHLTLSADGLPAGLSFADRGNGTGTVSGTVAAPTGSYTVTFSVSDGHNPAVSQPVSMTVNKAAATVTMARSNPKSVTVRTARDRAKLVTFRATIKAAGASSQGDISRAGPVTYTLTSNAGAHYSCTASTKAGAAGTLATQCSFRNLKIGTYRLQVSLGGAYYQGSAEAGLRVYALSRSGRP